MTYSYTQISQYTACPRRYRYRYLDGWREKDTRAAMVFGQVFERALSAYFRREDSAAALFQEWSAFHDADLDYPAHETWDRMLHVGIQLLDRFAQEDRVRISRPRKNLQVKFTRRLSDTNDFVAYVDALGKLDGEDYLLEWKTTGSRYAEEPSGLLALDPQLICYSWMTGIAKVACVVFVRKRMPEIQYLKTTITDDQRGEFEQMTLETVRQIEGGKFFSRNGIRYPQNPCVSCAYQGLCLTNEELVTKKLIHRPGADLGWLDELCF